MTWLLIGIAAFFGAAIIKGIAAGTGKVDWTPREYSRPRQLMPTSERAIQIIYSDAEGRTSTRPIIIRWLEEMSDGDVMIVAYCKLRKAERSFRLSQITRIIARDGTAFDNSRAFFLRKMGGNAEDFAGQEI